MMKIISIISLIFLFLSTCEMERKEEQLEVIPIDLDRISQVAIDSLIENVNLVLLEVNDSCLINHVDKIKLYRDRFFILDRKLGNIFIFNKKGEFESKISKKGRGPGEYLMISDFDIKPGTDDVYILDLVIDKLMLFRNGEFVKEYRLEFGGSKVTSFCFLNANKVVFESKISTNLDDMKYRLYITDTNLNIVSKEIPYEKSSPSTIVLSSISPLCPFENIISYNPLYNNIVYHIDNERTTPVYELDFGKNWIDEKYLMSPNLDFRTLFQHLKKSNSIYFLNVVESSHHLFIYFTFKGERYAFLYNKNSKKGSFIKDYMKNGCGFNGLPLLSDSDTFIGLVNPYEMSNINKTEMLKLYSQPKNVNFEYNYIISFIKFTHIN